MNFAKCIVAAIAILMGCVAFSTGLFLLGVSATTVNTLQGGVGIAMLTFGSLTFRAVVEYMSRKSDSNGPPKAA